LFRGIFIRKQEQLDEHPQTLSQFHILSFLASLVMNNIGKIIHRLVFKLSTRKPRFCRSLSSDYCISSQRKKNFCDQRHTPKVLQSFYPS